MNPELKALIYSNCLHESDRLIQCKADARRRGADLTQTCKPTATRLASCIASVICDSQKQLVNNQCRDHVPGQPKSAACLAAVAALDSCFRARGLPSPMQFKDRKPPLDS